jgi:hypothetical protein
MVVDFLNGSLAPLSDRMTRPAKVPFADGVLREDAGVGTTEQRAGVDLTNLDQPLGPDACATKRDLIDYLDAVADRMLPGLVNRPLTVLRVLRGRAPFMQKNVPKYTPDFVRTVVIWAEASKR